jgi:TRAP-type uncharacterized transport system fused permease subunit
MAGIGLLAVMLDRPVLSMRLVAFAAAAISKYDPIETSIIGCAYDVRTAILPFLFIFNTDLLSINVGLAKGLFVFAMETVAMLLFTAATQTGS